MLPLDDAPKLAGVGALAETLATTAADSLRTLRSSLRTLATSDCRLARP